MKPGFLPHFSVVFEERYILLTDQISLPNCLYFLRYWGIYVLYLFVGQSVMIYLFGVNLHFLIKPFLYITKKSRQNFKYLKNKKSF